MHNEWTRAIQVATDIASRLGIPPSNVVRTPFYRPTLFLSAIRAPDDPVERTNTLAKYLKEQGEGMEGAAQLDGGGACVVYVTLQKTAVEVAAALVEAGLDARPYHAGLPDLQREETQDWFMNAPDAASPVVVGTIAFGMGLDKKNVRRVFHFNLPKSPEDLAQQVGRAGRDGIAASCVTLVSGADLPLLRSMIYGGTPSPDAVLGLLRTLFEDNQDQADFSLYEISQALDTRDLVLKTLLAHLQIMGLVREMTPYYDTADVGLTDAGRSVLATQDDREGPDPDVPREWMEVLQMTETLLKRKRSGAKWATLKVYDAANVLGVPTTQIASILSKMSDRGLTVQGKQGKIRSRFQILRRPRSDGEETSLARHLHKTALELESRELGRLDTTMEILCANEGAAMSSGLSRYFGDSEETVSKARANEQSLRVPSGTGPLSELLTLPEMPGRAIDDAWQAGVLDLLQGHDDSENWNDEEERVIPRDDAYLLARFAAGIRSPRIGKLRLAQLGSFGCCAHCPFPDLLERAQAAVGD